MGRDHRPVQLLPRDRGHGVPRYAALGLDFTLWTAWSVWLIALLRQRRRPFEILAD
jgi:hypothetical protein